MKSPLLAAAFPAGKQKGPKISKKPGDQSGDYDTQHGALANSEKPRRVAKAKGAKGAQNQAPSAPQGDFSMSKNGADRRLDTKTPKLMKHETKKVIPKDEYSLSKNGASQMISPAEKAMQAAHRAKLSATSDWIAGHKTSEEHDAVHRRANAVLRAARRGS